MSLIIRYRPEIDGLRAVAVLAVVLFHAGFGCSGGYIGVDVFFVISGYLITSLIWKDLNLGRFTFVHFWEKRVRRIVPALVVVTIATLITGYFLLLPLDFKILGKASIAQSAFAANFYYWRQLGGYFDNAADVNPLLHTWSLAVEEQFYLFVPFLLWGLFRSTIWRSRTTIVFLLAIGFIFSLAISIYGVIHFPSASFYLLPTRAWELLLGALVAFLPSSLSLLTHSRLVREILIFAGLLFILIPIFSYTQTTPFPGFAALPPCLGAAMIIWITERSDSKVSTTVIGMILSLRPIVFIGLISYSLYLWHWPLLAFSKYITLAPLSSSYRIAILSLAFFIAIFSWKYIETPFRVRQLGSTRISMFIISGLGVASIFCIGLLCIVMEGFPQRFSAQAQKFANATHDRNFLNELTVDDIRTGNLIHIGSTDPALCPTILVWGDSHAMSALPAIDIFLQKLKISGRAATHSSTAPVLNWFMHTNFGLNEESVAFNDAVFSYIRSQKIRNVILIGFWSSYITNGGVPDAFNASLLSTVQQLASIGSHPWLFLDVPHHSFNVPKMLALSDILPLGITSSDANQMDKFDMINPQTITDIKIVGGRILDPKPRFLDPTGLHYIVQAGGIALYVDGQHLTTNGAKLTLLPLLQESLNMENLKN